jgi:two-component system, NarL family, invasion response regulator UvrY
MKILVVDDHHAAREGVRSLFSGKLDTQVIEAGSAAEALSFCRSDKPDVIVMDLNLPDMQGTALLSLVVSENRSAKVVVFSAHTSPIYASQTFAAGALGYISKGAQTQEVIDAINAVALGKRYVENDIAVKMVLAPYGGNSPTEQLTPRENEVVQLLIQGEEISGIATALAISRGTAANYISAIKRKLNIDSTVDLIAMHRTMDHERP